VNPPAMLKRRLPDTVVTSASPLDSRTELSESEMVKGAEFGHLSVCGRQGERSHDRLYLGDEFTTLKDRKKEIGRNPLIDPHDL
jgi:hypothetical protein